MGKIGKILLIVGGILSLLGTFVFCWYAESGDALSVYSIRYIGNAFAGIVDPMDYVAIILTIITFLAGIFILLGVKVRALAIIFGIISLFMALSWVLFWFDIGGEFIDGIIGPTEGLVGPGLFAGFPISVALGDIQLGAYLSLVGGVLGVIGGIIYKKE